MTEVKHRRLMDLLAGWQWFAAKNATSKERHMLPDRAQYQAECDAIFDLYLDKLIDALQRIRASQRRTRAETADEPPVGRARLRGLRGPVAGLGHVRR